MDHYFEGKRIIVAGASSGIGLETALQLNKLGAGLILVARNEKRLMDAVNQMNGDNRYYVFDLSDTGTIASLFEKIYDDYGPVDGLVYTAGSSATVPLRLLTPGKLQGIFNVNFFAFVECIRQLSSKGRFCPGTRIVGVSSVAAVRGDKSKTAYSASKAAMDSAVRSMAVELSAKGICINTVAPGLTDTEMYRKYVEISGDGSDAAQRLLDRQYLGLASTSDIANAIIFLLSDRARLITGITLPVDGGLTTS